MLTFLVILVLAILAFTGLGLALGKGRTKPWDLQSLHEKRMFPIWFVPVLGLTIVFLLNAAADYADDGDEFMAGVGVATAILSAALAMWTVYLHLRRDRTDRPDRT